MDCLVLNFLNPPTFVLIRFLSVVFNVTGVTQPQNQHKHWCVDAAAGTLAEEMLSLVCVQTSPQLSTLPVLSE